MEGCLSALMPVGPLHAVADRLAGDGCKMLSQVSVMVCYLRTIGTSRSIQQECSRGCEIGCESRCHTAL